MGGGKKKKRFTILAFTKFSMINIKTRKALQIFEKIQKGLYIKRRVAI